MTQLGRASIEVVGDVSKLGRRLKRDAQRAVDDIDLNTEQLTQEIAEAFTEAAVEAGDAFDEIGDHFERTTERLRSDSENFARALELDAQRIADAIGVSVDTAQRWIERLQNPIERNRKALIALGATLTDVTDGGGEGFRQLGRRMRDAGEDTQSFIQLAKRGLTSLGDTLTTVASTAAGIVITGINPAGLVTMALWVALIVTAIPVVLGLAAALADLAGLLTVVPAAIGVLAASLIVGIAAFQGFGDAISAVVDGDPDKIAEALEKLAPAAQKVVKEFQALLPLFRRVGDAIQQRFFEPLVGIVAKFGENTLPRLRNELDGLGEAMGRAFGHLGDLLIEAKNVGILERLLASTTRITDTLGAAVGHLGQSLLNALDAGLPSLERLTGGLAGMIDRFSKFINESIKDGSFQAFFEDALDTLAELADLTGAVGELFAVLFAGTDDSGRGFIGTLADLTRRMTEFFKSAEGQDTLQDFSEIIAATGLILGGLVNVVIFVIDVFNELDDAVHTVRDFFTDLGDTIASIWNEITTSVGGGVDSIIAWFQSLPDRIVEFVQSIPERVGVFFSMLIDNALTTLAFGIAAIIVLFTDMPGQVTSALSALWDKIVEWFDLIRDSAVEKVQAIILFFAGMPDRIGEFLSTLPERIDAFFARARDGAIEKLKDLLLWVAGLPNRIKDALGDAGSTLYNAGRRIIQGLINGISDKIGDLKRKIAEAVQTIRDHLPFSPAKLGPLSGAGSPQIAGAKIAEMIAAGLESGMPLITGSANRSAGAVADAGLTPLATAAPGAPAPTLSPVQVSVEQQPMFVVTIGNEQIDAHIERIVEQRVQIETRRLLAGSRGI